MPRRSPTSLALGLLKHRPRDQHRGGEDVVDNACTQKEHGQAKESYICIAGAFGVIVVQSILACYNFDLENNLRPSKQSFLLDG